jgi:RimJ/RimL family protein N-acetyltransferase
MQITELLIESKRLSIRPYLVSDAESIKNGIDESLVELRKFMPWAKYEPEAVIHKAKRIERWLQDILDDRDYTLGIFNKENEEFIGSTGFHKRREKGVFEIGYWIHKDYQGNGYITEAVEVLTDFAFEKLEAEKVQIRCSEQNIKSSNIAKRLHYTLEYTFRTLEKNEIGERKKNQVWVMFKEDWKNDSTHS